MTAEDSAERSEFRRMQRELERERRRMRDRQRRQSMTEEQRERHLARRRRNYQLRRLRAETTRVDTISQEASIPTGFEMVVSNEHHQPVSSVPETSFHDDGFNPIRFIQGQEKLNAECLQSVETLARKSTNLTKKLRLSHIRCVARSLNRLGGGVGGSHQNVTEFMSKRDADAILQLGDNDSGGLPGGLRLNRIKRLARALNIANNETNGQSHQVEQNLPREDTQVVSCDKPKFGQPTLVRGEDETTL